MVAVAVTLVRPPSDVGQSPSDVDPPPLVVGETLGVIQVVTPLRYIGGRW